MPLLLIITSFYTFTMEDSELTALKKKFLQFKPPIDHKSDKRNYYGKLSKITYTCEACIDGTTYTDIKAFTQHLNEKHTFFGYACSHLGCTKRFLKKSEMTSHRGEHEKNEDTITCTTCFRIFLNSRKLRDHCRDTKWVCCFYQCNFCTNKYQHQNELRSHELVAHQKQLVSDKKNSLEFIS